MTLYIIKSYVEPKFGVAVPDGLTCHLMRGQIVAITVNLRDCRCVYNQASKRSASAMLQITTQLVERPETRLVLQQMNGHSLG
jgi:hypothetical protein